MNVGNASYAAYSTTFPAKCTGSLYKSSKDRQQRKRERVTRWCETVAKREYGLRLWVRVLLRSFTTKLTTRDRAREGVWENENERERQGDNLRGH